MEVRMYYLYYLLIASIFMSNIILINPVFSEESFIDKLNRLEDELKSLKTENTQLQIKLDTIEKNKSNNYIGTKALQTTTVSSRKSQIAEARSVCYSALARKTASSSYSLIILPLPSSATDLDAQCHKIINPVWHAGGIAKSHYLDQDCKGFLDNEEYDGGGYTSFVSESYFEGSREKFKKCGNSNAFICCSPQFDIK